MLVIWMFYSLIAEYDYNQWYFKFLLISNIMIYHINQHLHILL